MHLIPFSISILYMFSSLQKDVKAPNFDVMTALVSPCIGVVILTVIVKMVVMNFIVILVVNVVLNNSNVPSPVNASPQHGNVMVNSIAVINPMKIQHNAKKK